MAPLFARGTFVVVTDHVSLKWLLTWKEPRGRLARWVVDVQDHDFAVEHRAGKELVVPDTLSRDTVSNPLCQRCYRPLLDHDMGEIVGKKKDEVVSAVKIRGFGNGPTVQVIPSAQLQEFGDLLHVSATRRDVAVDE